MNMRLVPWQRVIRGLLALVVVSVSAWGAELRLVLLHTNDLHDHVRAGDSRSGGLPYVAGYVRQIRAEGAAVLLVDAGDVTEKGDLVAFRTEGVMTYEAMRRIGYDGVAVGNHDFDDVPPERIRRFEAALGQSLLCLNIVQPDGRPVFTPSRVVERGGLRIALIGMIVPREASKGGLDFKESGAALSREAKRLRAVSDLVVAVCHQSVPKCVEWSRAAPDVDVFVSGHSHQALPEPVVVPETGARVVQAGKYAQWVGRLDLVISTEPRRVVRHEGRLVPMDHGKVEPDETMLAWVSEREAALAPEAGQQLGENPAELDGFAVARLGAEALRRAARADVGFCHPYQVIRDVLPAGRVDVNAVFKAGGDRGREVVVAELTGAEIEAYVNALVSVQREPPEWTGFRVQRAPVPGGGERWSSDLEATRRYRVVLPTIEWETRLLRLADQLRSRDPANPLAARTLVAAKVEVNFTDATVAYLREVVASGDTWPRRAEALVKQREGGRAP
ncbi:MAG: bifunctional metallophosphatase/5'-nucleotidase [Opitutaceae bacterium]|nr:bifunctional metallophosphatase/5'-nucleotidase [Opitutaceae bacterium]